MKSNIIYSGCGYHLAGKSTILRCISDILPKGQNFEQSGEVSLSGISPTMKGISWPSLVGFMDQIDRLHPYLTGKNHKIGIGKICAFARESFTP